MVDELAGVLWFTAMEEDNQSMRFNLFRLDLSSLSIDRITRDELCGAVVVDERDLFACPLNRRPGRVDGRKPTDASAEFAPSIWTILPSGPSVYSQPVLTPDRLYWTEADHVETSPARLVSCLRDGSDLNAVFETTKDLSSPVLAADGTLYVMEKPRGSGYPRPSQCRLVAVSVDSRVRRSAVAGPQRGWYVGDLVGIADDVIVATASAGPDRDNAKPLCGALLRPNGEPQYFEGGRPVAVSPDGSWLLLQVWRRECTLRIAPLPALDWTRDVVRLGVHRITHACWTGSTVPAPASKRPRVSVTRLDEPPRLVERAERGSKDPLPDIGLPVGRSEGIWIAEHSRYRLEEPGGDLVVAIRGAADDGAVAAALRSAGQDLYWLGTSPTEEGEIDIPSFVSEPMRIEGGAHAVRIDAKDTQPEQLRLIPSIVRRHLEAAGVTNAEIVCT